MREFPKFPARIRKPERQWANRRTLESRTASDVIFWHNALRPFKWFVHVQKVSPWNHLSDWWNFSNSQSEAFIRTIFKAYTPRSFAINGSFYAKELEKSSSGNVVKSCVHFCFESLLDLENAKKYEITDFSYIVTTKNQSLLRTFYIS